MLLIADLMKRMSANGHFFERLIMAGVRFHHTYITHDYHARSMTWLFYCHTRSRIDRRFDRETPITKDHTRTIRLP